MHNFITCTSLLKKGFKRSCFHFHFIRIFCRKFLVLSASLGKHSLLAVVLLFRRFFRHIREFTRSNGLKLADLKGEVADGRIHRMSYLSFSKNLL